MDRKRIPFPPLALPGENICVRYYDGKIEYYHVITLEQIPGVLITVSSVPAGGESSFTDQDSNGKLLLPNDRREENLHQLVQYRILPLTANMYVQVYQPRDTAKWVLKNVVAAVYRPAEISDYERFWINFYSPLTEFYILNEKATFKIIVGNTAGSAEDKKILFMGWKFLMSRLEEKPERYTLIQIGPTLPLQ